MTVQLHFKRRNVLYVVTDEIERAGDEVAARQGDPTVCTGRLRGKDNNEY